MASKIKSNTSAYFIHGKNVSLSTFRETINTWKKNGYKIITTNGCFDLIHSGHTTYLQQAKNIGGRLIVGLNSDGSVRQIKGEGKPIVEEKHRAAILSALQSVDAVVTFDDLLPTKFLELIKPDIHCKAGDYSEKSLPEADVVKKNNGQIKILPLVEGISTSTIVERIISGNGVQPFVPSGIGSVDTSDTEEWVIRYLLISSNLFRQTAYRLKGVILQAYETMATTLERKNKILLCGNGGSAADSQHIAAEFVGRFKRERQALPALALTTDTSVLTAIGNDYGYDQVFARQIAAHGSAGDVLIAISTSGNSSNILMAVEEAKQRGIHVIGFTGGKPSALKEAADLCIAVPSEDTALVQQVHIGILHLLCDLCERRLSK